MCMDIGFIHIISMIVDSPCFMVSSHLMTLPAVSIVPFSIFKHRGNMIAGAGGGKLIRVFPRFFLAVCPIGLHCFP